MADAATVYGRRETGTDAASQQGGVTVPAGTGTGAGRDRVRGPVALLGVQGELNACELLGVISCNLPCLHSEGATALREGTGV